MRRALALPKGGECPQSVFVRSCIVCLAAVSAIGDTENEKLTLLFQQARAGCRSLPPSGSSSLPLGLCETHQRSCGAWCGASSVSLICESPSCSVKALYEAKVWRGKLRRPCRGFVHAPPSLRMILSFDLLPEEKGLHHTTASLDRATPCKYESAATVS